MEWAFTQKRFAFVVQFVKIKSVFAVPTMVLCPFLLNLLCHYSSSSRKLFNKSFFVGKQSHSLCLYIGS